MLVRLYEALFYRFYQWSCRNWGKDNAPLYFSIIGITLAIFANLATIPFMIEFFIDIEVTKHIVRLGKTGFLVIIVSIFFAKYIFLTYKSRHRDVLERYRHEDDDTKRRGMKFAGMYYIFSILSFVFFGGASFF